MEHGSKIENPSEKIPFDKHIHTSKLNNKANDPKFAKNQNIMKKSKKFQNDLNNSNFIKKVTKNSIRNKENQQKFDSNQKNFEKSQQNEIHSIGVEIDEKIPFNTTKEKVNHPKFASNKNPSKNFQKPRHNLKKSKFHEKIPNDTKIQPNSPSFQKNLSKNDQNYESQFPISHFDENVDTIHLKNGTNFPKNDSSDDSTISDWEEFYDANCIEKL